MTFGWPAAPDVTDALWYWRAPALPLLAALLAPQSELEMPVPKLAELWPADAMVGEPVTVVAPAGSWRAPPGRVEPVSYTHLTLPTKA